MEKNLINLPWVVWNISPDSDPKERCIVTTQDGEMEVTGILDQDVAELIVTAANNYRGFTS